MRVLTSQSFLKRVWVIYFFNTISLLTYVYLLIRDGRFPFSCLSSKQLQFCYCSYLLFQSLLCPIDVLTLHFLNRFFHNFILMLISYIWILVFSYGSCRLSIFLWRISYLRCDCKVSCGYIIILSHRHLVMTPRFLKINYPDLSASIFL